MVFPPTKRFCDEKQKEKQKEKQREKQEQRDVIYIDSDSDNHETITDEKIIEYKIMDENKVKLEKIIKTNLDIIIQARKSLEERPPITRNSFLGGKATLCSTIFRFCSLVGTNEKNIDNLLIDLYNMEIIKDDYKNQRNDKVIENTNLVKNINELKKIANEYSIKLFNKDKHTKIMSLSLKQQISLCVFEKEARIRQDANLAQFYRSFSHHLIRISPN